MDSHLLFGLLTVVLRVESYLMTVYRSKYKLHLERVVCECECERKGLLSNLSKFILYCTVNQIFYMHKLWYLKLYFSIAVHLGTMEVNNIIGRLSNICSNLQSYDIDCNSKQRLNLTECQLKTAKTKL